jgi:DNA modification methylase
VTVRTADCIEAMAELDECSVDAVVTDPPYGIGFMGREWDVFAPARLEELDSRRRRKSTKRTSECWPKKLGDSQGGGPSVEYDFSLRGSHAFQAWCETWGGAALRALKPGGHAVVFGGTRTHHRLVAGLEDAGFEIRDTLAWLFGQGFPKSLNVGDGWGTALKPAHEPIVLARKPLAGTVAATRDEHGTGALNIAACVVDVDDRQAYERNHSGDRGHTGTRGKDKRGSTDLRPGGGSAAEGRWPANVLLDEDAADLLDEQVGELVSGANPTRRKADKFRAVFSPYGGQQECEPKRGVDVGGASRFFYCAKTSKSERHAGTADGNIHPTVKPLALMRWLCRLITPPGGLILDPFTGSGTTGCAAALEGFGFLGFEREPEYAAVAEARIAHWRKFGAEQLALLA